VVVTVVVVPFVLEAAEAGAISEGRVVRPLDVQLEEQGEHVGLVPHARRVAHVVDRRVRRVVVVVHQAVLAHEHVPGEALAEADLVDHALVLRAREREGDHLFLEFPILARLCFLQAYFLSICSPVWRMGSKRGSLTC